MAVIYQGNIPKRNYSLKDFHDKGVILCWVVKYYRHKTNKPSIRVIFRSNGLLGEIRTTCYGDSYAVDVRWGWYTNQQKCLTTECKSLREAKSILYEWFKSKGFVVPKKETDSDWSKNYLSFTNVQLELFIK